MTATWRASLDRHCKDETSLRLQREFVRASCRSRHRSQALLLSVGSLRRETFFPVALRPVSAMKGEVGGGRMSKRARRDGILCAIASRPRHALSLNALPHHPPSMSTTLDRRLRRRTLRSAPPEWRRPCCSGRFSPFLDFVPDFPISGVPPFLRLQGGHHRTSNSTHNMPAQCALMF
jgi:hypothetical protein